MEHFLFLSYNPSYTSIKTCFLTNQKDLFYLLDVKTMKFKDERFLNFKWFLTIKDSEYIKVKISDNIFNYLLSGEFDTNKLNDISKLSSLMKLEEQFI